MDKFLKNILLKNYTTFKIGGPAKYFFIAKTKEDLLSALKTAKTLKLPVFILGGGSNVLFSDKGYHGLAVQIRNSKFEIRNLNVFADAGVNLTKLAHATAQAGLSGLEWAAGIPGTIGGAIYGSAQAFEVKISDAVESVQALDIKTLQTKTFSNKQCQFSLKDSIFKRNKNLIIISAVLQLKKDNPEEIEKRIKDFLQYRKERHPLNFPSAGSVFINPEGHQSWKLIKDCGLSGKKIGGAQISDKHTNFIINTGNAKASDVIKLIKLAQKQVKKKFNINLESEIQIIK